MTSNVEIAYRTHIAMLRRSDVADHRVHAEEIALTALRKRRADHAKHPRRTEPYKAAFEATLREYDALISSLGG